MAYTKYIYNKTNWINKSEGLTTPIGKERLNNIENGIYNIAENLDVVYSEMSTGKFNEADAGKVITGMPTWDPDTGIFTIRFYDGTEFSMDFNIEKIPVSFSMDSAGVITMTTSDGTQWTADIGDVIPDYTFQDSDRIAFTRTRNADGSYTVTADIKKNSISGDYLEPNYLADITAQASGAAASAKQAADSADAADYDAKMAQSYAIGGSGIREGEDADNAKASKEMAERAAEQAQQALETMQEAQVTSVNGQRGDVSVTAESISAVSNTDVKVKNETVTDLKTNFRGRTYGENADNSYRGNYISEFRNNNYIEDVTPLHSSGIAFGGFDTHGWICPDYAKADVIVGAGNANKLNWTKHLAFQDSTLPLTGGTLTGNAKIARLGDGASPQWIAERSDTGVRVWCGVGYGGVNHGLYSDTFEKWIAYADDTGGIHLNGNAETATKATQDGNGNNIEETYATKESLNAKKNVSYTTLPDGTDLNEVTTGGSYYLNHTYSYENMPSQLVNGMMDVLRYSSLTKQIIYRGGTIGTNDWMIVERTGILSSGTWSWSEWIQVVTEKTGFAYGVKTTLANPTAKTSYYIPLVPGSTGGNKNMQQNDEFRIDSLEGTASALGYDALVIGNNTPKGTAGNKYGQLSLYSESAYVGYMKPANLTANRAYTLPDKAGTLAMLSDVDSKVSNAPLERGNVSTGPVTCELDEDKTYIVGLANVYLALIWFSPSSGASVSVLKGDSTPASVSVSGTTMSLKGVGTTLPYFIKEI